MPRFRRLMLIKCPRFFTGECDHTCPHFSHFLLENCSEDCPSCPMAVRNRCPCVDHAQVEAYWQHAVDEHTLLPARLVVPSTLVPQVVPPPALVQAIRRRGGLVIPLVVRPWDHGKRERYEVVASQEVYGAAREAGLDRLPVVIKRRLSDRQALELMREIPLYLGSCAGLHWEADLDKRVIQFPTGQRIENWHKRATRKSSERGRVVG